MEKTAQKQAIYILLVLAIIIAIIFSVYSVLNKKSPQSVNTVTTAEDQQKQLEEYLKQDALLGSIATSTNGKEMVYTNKKYSYSFNYPNNWTLGNNVFGSGQIQLFKDTYYINNDNSSSYNFRYTYKIETALVKNSDQTNFDEGGDKISSTTVSINGTEVKRLDFSHYSNGEVGEKYIRSYIIPLQSDMSYSLAVTMYNFGTSTSDFTVIDNIVKSIKWLQK